MKIIGNTAIRISPILAGNIERSIGEHPGARHGAIALHLDDVDHATILAEQLGAAYTGGDE
jgi:hypothetical protein